MQKPMPIQTHNADSTTHADSNPPLKPSHRFNFNIGTETQPTPKRPLLKPTTNPNPKNTKTTLYFKPSDYLFNPTKNSWVKREKNILREKEEIEK